jgi:Cof subfamily protein (haloacid dehalogenase superfamily)
MLHQNQWIDAGLKTPQSDDKFRVLLMPIKLLALDIDGTLLTSRGELTARNQTAIARARRAGVQIVLLTGRRFGSAYQLLRELQFEVPLVSHNGALTKDTQTLETLDIYPLEVAVAHRVIQAARDFGTDVICCRDEVRGPGKMVVEGVSDQNVVLHRYLVKYRDDVVEVGDLLAAIAEAPIQLMFSGRCAQMTEFADVLQAAMGDDIRLFQTRYPAADLTILDALSRRASKGDSLARVAEHGGFAREEVMAIGDNHNDLPMLHYAGLGVVMANAEPALKQLGFAETASNEESGVAAAIEHYIFDSSAPTP